MKYYIATEKIFLFNQIVPANTLFAVPDDAGAGTKWIEVNPDGSPLTPKQPTAKTTKEQSSL
jgi:hypothetical protein